MGSDCQGNHYTLAIQQAPRWTNGTHASEKRFQPRPDRARYVDAIMNITRTKKNG